VAGLSLWYCFLLMLFTNFILESKEDGGGYDSENSPLALQGPGSPDDLGVLLSNTAG
jgi:hypothetical protein